MLPGDRFRARYLASVAPTVFNAWILVEYRDGKTDYFEIDPVESFTIDRTGINLDGTSRINKKGRVVDGYVGGSFAGVKDGEFYALAGILHPGRDLTKLFSGYVHANKALALGVIEGSLSGKGRRVTNEGTSTLVNGTLLTRTLACPTNARWEVIGGQAVQGDDVTRDVLVIAKTAARDLIRLREETDAAAGAVISYPGLDDLSGGSTVQLASPVVLEETDEITITWRSGGASAGGAARSSAMVREWIHQ